MLQNQIKLMQELSGLGTYRTLHPELLELFPQPHDSLFHGHSSAGLCYPTESGCCFWAAATVVAVGSALSTVPLVLGGLNLALGAIVGIMSHFTTLKIAIGLNWIVVADWCS